MKAEFNSTQMQMLELAYYSATHSPDTSSQNGAIIYDGSRMIGRGFNKLPAGVRMTDERLNKRPDKYFYFEHAEREAIFDAVRRGKSTVGATIYCPWAACHDCARAIIGAGITRLVRHADRMLGTPDSWMDSVWAGEQMFAEAGVEIIEYRGSVNADPILVSGQLWSPK